MARKKWPALGSIVKIPFDDTQTYARVLESPYVAVFDASGLDDTAIPEILARPVLFFVGVYEDILKQGEWPVIGRAPLGDDELLVPDQFIQDPDMPEDIQIITVEGDTRDATIEECVGLEAAAIWDREHVEDRLSDHYAERPNAFLDSLALATEMPAEDD